MTTISTTGTSATATSTGATAKTSEKKANDQLDQADFLRLLTTQMQNQDPTNPLDGQQFMAQMAQFSTLNAIIEMKTSIDSLVKTLGTSTTTSTSTATTAKAATSTASATQTDRATDIINGAGSR
jgi:flagellar basal-body rod modification protein FlgD